MMKPLIFVVRVVDSPCRSYPWLHLRLNFSDPAGKAFDGDAALKGTSYDYLYECTIALRDPRGRSYALSQMDMSPLELHSAFSESNPGTGTPNEAWAESPFVRILGCSGIVGTNQTSGVNWGWELAVPPEGRRRSRLQLPMESSKREL